MTIDGKDVYTEWGCKLLEGSFDDLLKYPKRKAVKYNNWAEADGIDLDLSVVEFEPKTVKLKFLMKAETLEQFWSGYRKFVADLSAPGYREFNLEFNWNSHPKKKMIFLMLKKVQLSN